MGGGREESKMLEEDAKGELPANRLARFSVIGLCSSLLEALLPGNLCIDQLKRESSEQQSLFDCFSQSWQCDQQAHAV